MEQRNSAAANTRLRHTDWHALWSSSYACAWCTPFSKGTFPLVNPLRGNIPLAGAHFRALLAPVTVLLYGAKPWQLVPLGRPAVPDLDDPYAPGDRGGQPVGGLESR